jgi:hypothetical protein
LRAELGRQASNRARTEFSVQLNIARAEHLYESLLERKGRLKMSPSSASAEANSTPSTTVERL